MRPIKRQPETLRWFHSLRDNQRAWAAFSLVCSRVSGILLFAFSVVVFAVNLPAQAASFQRLFQAALSPAGPLSTDVASPLHALGLSESGYVIINMVLLMAAAFASFLVSGLILWRKGDDRVALLGATMLLSVGVVGPTALTGAFGMLVPAWPWHVFGQCLIFIAVLSFPLFFPPVTTFLVLLGPVYVGMAITRSHLWSIDLIIRRTLIYGLLTASLLGLYLLLVFGSQYLLASFFGSSNDVVLVVSTLIVAALFEPLRQRVQQMVDRRFYRSKYDATQILADFSETLHQEVDLDQLCVQLLAAVQQTMQPTSLSLWFRPRNPQEKLEQPGKKLPPA